MKFLVATQQRQNGSLASDQEQGFDHLPGIDLKKGTDFIDRPGIGSRHLLEIPGGGRRGRRDGFGQFDIGGIPAIAANRTSSSPAWLGAMNSWAPAPPSFQDRFRRVILYSAPFENPSIGVIMELVVAV